MHTSIAVRSARHDDVAAIRFVATTTWRATYADAIAADDIEQFLSSAYGEQRLAARIDQLGDAFLVAEAEDKVIGYAMAGLNRSGVPELFAIYVLPDYHGSGAGKQLWDAAVDALARRGHTRICAWVLDGNRRAERFYERQGATLVGTGYGQVGATTIRESRYCLTICPIGQASSE